MTTQSITWTALPNGVSKNGRLRLSVFVSPRLETTESEATLALFPDFLDWPRQIRGRLRNLLTVNLGPSLSVKPIILNPTLDSDLWKKLFPPQTRVCPYSYESLRLRDRVITTYPVSDVFGAIKKIYQEQTLMGYGPDHDLVRTRTEQREVPFVTRKSIDEILRRILEEKWFSDITPFDINDWSYNPISTCGNLWSYLFKDEGVSVSPNESEEFLKSLTSMQFRHIIVDAIHNNDDPLRAQLRQCLIDLANGLRNEEAAGRSYFHELSAGFDPGFDDIEVIEYTTETFTVAAENPIRDYANKVQKTIGFFAESVQYFYGVASGDAHRLPDPECQFDFHSILGSLGQYPEILRRLGIILDLEIDASPVSDAFHTWLTVDWSSPAPGIDTFNTTPYTWSYAPSANGQITDYQISENTSSEIIRGYLKLTSQEEFELIPIDVDGAALKVANFSDALRGMSDEKVYLNGDFVGLPALRTAGIGLVQNNRLHSLLELSKRADANNDKLVTGQQFDSSSSLYMEDVIRGFRVDIRDGEQRWRSLCQRDGTYAYPSNDGSVIQFSYCDEGWSVPSITTQPTSSTTTKDMLHESLFKWEGWSLAVGRPGKSVDAQGNLLDQNALKTQAETHIPLDFTATAPPGSLPRLRFGRRYHMRVRLADLAGNGRTLAAPDEPDAISSEITFRRFEPLTTPTLVLPRLLNPSKNSADQGANIERLVIHTGNTTLEDDIVKINASDERYVAPAQTSQLMAEMYGVFDNVIGQGAARDNAKTDTYKLIATKDAGAFVDNEGTLTIDPGMLRADGTLTLPYLPDPAVRGIALVNLPGAPVEQVGEIKDGILRYYSPYSDVLGHLGKSVTHIPILGDNDWPDALPFKLRIVEGDQQPKWDTKQRLLSVFLPKAHTAQVLLSSYGNTDDHGLLAWIREASPAVEVDTLRNVEDAVRYGVHRLITPSRAIMFVHAVQQPIGFPSIERLRIKPNDGALTGNTFVDLDSEFWTHSFSTVKLDIIAEWTQNVDEPANASPKSEVAHQQLVLEQTVPLESESDPKVPRGDFNFVSESVGIKRVTRHEFQDTKYRHIRYRLQGLTRFREFFPPDPEIVSQATPSYTRDSEVIELDIPNRSRPLTPKIVLVIPTFRWIREKNADIVTSKRICGLRVYLERPWYSSGDGELLGIVTSTHSDREAFDQDIDTGFSGNEWIERDPRITHWGADPIWQANQVWKFRAQDALKPDKVTDEEWAARVVNAYWSDTLLNRSITEDATRIVCYAPQYDPDRDQWFADIEFASSEIYFPFIRLALVRYQPISLKESHFSEVVLADFAQLPPNRTLKCTGLTGKTLNLTLTGSAYKGRAQSDGTVQTTTNRVSAVVERRLAMIADPDLGWESIEGSEITLKSVSDVNNVRQVEWNGSLPIPVRDAGSQYRVIIKEYEEFERWHVSSQSLPIAQNDSLVRITFVESILL